MAEQAQMTVSDEAAITIENMNKWYGSFHVLRDIDLTVYEGERIVICGPSGSGKSTLIRCINRLEKFQKGELFVDGTPLHDHSTNLTKLRAEIGFVFQFYNLMASLTARENVALVTEIAEKPLAPEEALEIVGLESRIDHFPSQLSGGEQQRVAIARALVNEPSILLADEPTGNLDDETGRRVMDLLLRLVDEESGTLVYVTHSRELADLGFTSIDLAFGQGDQRRHACRGFLLHALLTSWSIESFKPNSGSSHSQREKVALDLLNQQAAGRMDVSAELISSQARRRSRQTKRTAPRRRH